MSKTEVGYDKLEGGELGAFKRQSCHFPRLSLHQKRMDLPGFLAQASQTLRNILVVGDVLKL